MLQRHQSLKIYDVLNELMKLPHTDVYVTGSNSKMLSKDVATNFRDRGVEVRLHPLSFAEFACATKAEKVVDVLSSSVGSLTNPNKLVNALKSTLGVKTSNVTLQKYLGYLEDSFLFASVRRFDVKGRHYLDYPEKYYAEDVGIRNARMNFRQTGWIRQY